ncbi:hypothetical protein IWW50_006880, partial [Coemansia erecta]
MVLKSDDVNYLVYRYLRESGFLHTSYIFQFESQLHKNDEEMPNVEPGSLIRVLQKGLQYMDVETHLNEDGTARLCTAPFSLVGKHVCSVHAEARAGGKASSEAPKSAVRAFPAEAGSDAPKPTARVFPAEASPHGGHTLVHDAKEKRAVRTIGDHEDEGESMDVDVPDAEREVQRADSGRAKKRGRVVESVQMLHGHSSP